MFTLALAQLACTATGAVNTSPDVRITDPEDGEEFHAGETLTFTAVADDDAGVLALEFAWTVDPDPASEGHAFVSETEASWYFEDGFPEGDYTVGVVATDYAGATASDEVEVEVEANDAPRVTVEQPEDGEVYDLGNPLIVQVKIKARDDNMSAISLTWGGIAEGVDDAPDRPPDDGVVIFYIENVEQGRHELSVTARDSGGAAETETVEFRVQ